jgi:N-terminal domain of (some) glycogen debranching enzymes
MPIQIHAGQPTTAISQGRTFMVTAPSGEIISNTEQGLFSIDTRFLNSYSLYLNGQALEPITMNIHRHPKNGKRNRRKPHFYPMALVNEKTASISRSPQAQL